MKLTQEQKKKLLQTASDVYSGYVALDFFKTRAFTTNNTPTTLLQLCEATVREKKTSQLIVLNQQTVTLEVTPNANGTYHVSLQSPTPHDTPRKSITHYTDDDALALLTQQHFSLHRDKKGVLHVANTLQPDTILGGIGKIDLYRSHLVTLHNIIEKITAEEDISNLLVALATGSGKTYVQALWILILSLSDNNAVFAVPNKLIHQFRDDLKRILPNDLVDSLLTLREKEACPEAEAMLSGLNKPSKSSQILIGSSEKLLDDHYEELLAANPESTFLSFDEQHLLMKSERRRVRLIELSKKMLSMFLTATPNQETYQLSGHHPVAIMSSGQKQAAGQGQFPILFTEKARNISDRNRLSHYRFWTRDFFTNLGRGLLLRFSNAIQQEKSSAAVSIVESLPFYHHRKPNETNTRWRMQVPMAHKMLCIIDDNETLVNFCHALENDDPTNRDVYCNGNFVDRRDIAQFFGLPNVDTLLIREDRHKKEEQYRSHLSEEERLIGDELAHTPLKEQIKRNIFHNMMEYVLTDLTGLDEIEHNRQRKENPLAFQALIRSKLHVRSTDYYQEKLKKLIDPMGAETIASLLAHFNAHLHSINATNKNDFNELVDNWSLNAHLAAKTVGTDPEVRYLFDNYTNRHVMMSVMTGMDKSETPIQESKPFLKLHEDRYRIYKDGTLSDKAKQRAHSALETLNDESEETTLTPDYLDVTEEQCDNYFRLGFIGIYVSNKKTEGFSDRNLHTVINLAESTVSSTNSPETLIQGIGRNRGLDDTIVPTYIHALGRKQNTLFDLEQLQSNDYYPALFNAQTAFNKRFINVLGKNVSTEIIRWFNANIKEDDSIDADKLKKEVLHIIARALRHLNNNNSHNIRLSRSQLTTVVHHAMNAIKKEITRINKPYQLSLSVRILGSCLNALCSIYYYFQKRVADKQLQKEAKVTAASNPNPDSVYINIIKNTRFKSLIKHLSVAKESRNWLTHQSKSCYATLSTDLKPYLNQVALAQLASQHNIPIDTILRVLPSLFAAKDSEEIALSEIDFRGIADPGDLLSALATLAKDPQAYLNKEALSELIAARVTPALFHEKFRTTLQTLMGFLNQQELTVMLKAMGKTDCEKNAGLIVQLMQVIKTKDTKALKEHFLSLPQTKEFSLEQLPIVTVTELIGDLLQEILDCQCHYNHHDRTGTQFEPIKPKLYAELSQPLQDLSVPAHNSFLSHFSRKIFFIQGIRNGLTPASTVSAAANQHRVRALQQIHDHILRPLWWGTNMSRIGYALIKIGQNIIFALKALMNGIKTTKPHPMDTDYNHTAFDIAKDINALTPFDAAHVRKKTCPIDVIHNIESTIATRRHHRLFTPAIPHQEHTPNPTPTRTL